MFIEIVLRFALLLALVSPSATGAVGIPLISDNLGKSEEGLKEAPLPDPVSLEAAWWRYFEVSGNELTKHVEETLKRLDLRVAEVSQDMLVIADPFITRIRANLQALPQARSQPSPEPPAPLVYAERYSLSQLLEMGKRLRDIRIKLEDERKDVADADKAIKAFKRRIDTLMAAYLGLSAADSTRLVKGLEIMAERTEVGVAEERLRVRTAAMLADEALARQLEDELEVAAGRLEAQYADLARLNTEIEQAEQDLKKAEERTLKEQTSALNVVADNPAEQATAQYRQQRVIRAAVQEANARARLIRLQAERNLVSLLLGTVGIDVQAAREELVKWNAQLADMRKRSDAWISDSERERGRTGASMAVSAEPASSETPGFLSLINQDRFSLAQETLVALGRLQEENIQATRVIELVDEQLALKEGWLSTWLTRGKQILSTLRDQAAEWVSTSLFRIGETPVTALGLLQIALILTIAWWISYWLRRALNRLGELRDGANISAYYTVGRLSHYVIIIIGMMVGLSSIGMDFTNFALVAGALAIGIGFGLQAIVNNFISGLILLFERSLKVGDFVELASGVVGEVREINVRSTLINTNDNVDIVVPNSELMSTNVVNWTLMENYRRIHLPFKVAYGTDKDLVRQAGLEAAEKVPHTLSGIPGKNPGVWLVGFGESSLSFELVVWITPRAVKRPAAVHAAYMWEIESALRKYGIEIPYPQRDLHLRSGFKALLEADAAPSATVKPKPQTLEKKASNA